MKFEISNIESLSNNELLEISGGQNPDKPHGVLQWLGYGVMALFDSNNWNTTPSSGGQLMNTALH
ncbi:MAG: hypothetical protein H7339_04830 [Arcicella sp.]|nr:hypothetical protein [Arcicella sp.]